MTMTVWCRLDDEGVLVRLDRRKVRRAVRQVLGVGFEDALVECECCGEQTAVLTFDEAEAVGRLGWFVLRAVGEWQQG